MPDAVQPSPLPDGRLPAEDALPSDVLSAIRRLPKAELHLHLDGSLRPATALELARERGLDAGLSLPAIRSRLMSPMPCVSQDQLLDAFDLPEAILQDAESLERVTLELVEDVASDGTRYAEIRWGPTLHLERGLSLRDGIAAVVRGAQRGAAATGVTVRLIAVAIRTHERALNVEMTRVAADFLGDGLTGFDCAGREHLHPDPLEFADSFAIARDAGLGITVHAGEWGGPAQVRRALSVDPLRIAHGAPAGEDVALQDELIARGVTLDLCPTSNWQAGTVARYADHPVIRLHRRGVPVTFNTDDRTVSDLTLPREAARAMQLLGMTLPELAAMTRHALSVAFLHHDEALRARLIAELDAAVAADPLLRGDIA
ncbi:MAG: adenosine deaminase [Chloroflexota bacterium]